MVFSGRTRRKRLGPPVGTEGLRTRAKTITDFGAHSPSPRPSPIGWERENRRPSVGVSNRFRSCERRVWCSLSRRTGEGQGESRFVRNALPVRYLFLQRPVPRRDDITPPAISCR